MPVSPQFLAESRAREIRFQAFVKKIHESGAQPQAIADDPANHVTLIEPAPRAERVTRKQEQSHH